MRRFGLALVGVVALCAVTFANPLEGNVLGFCPVSEGPKALAVDAVVATVDVVAAWLVFRGIRG